MSDPARARVAVLGGGVAGLAAAWQLVRSEGREGPPPSVHLYESSARLGGVILTEYEDGFLLDAGPDSLLAFKPSAIELCRAIGLGEDLVPTLPTEVGVGLYSRGEMRRLPTGFDVSVREKILRFVGSGLISLPGLLRMGADLLLPAGDLDGDRSMAEFFGRRLGREAVERLVDPLLAGIYAGDPDRLSIQATFPRFPGLVEERRSLLLAGLGRPGRRPAGGPREPSRETGERAAGGESGSGGPSGSMFYSLRRGLGAMVCALAEEIGHERISLNAHVEAVEPVEGGYRLRTTQGPRGEYDGIVLAVPAWAAASILRDLTPELSARLQSIRYASSATVFLGYRKADLARLPEGHGFLIPRVEGRRINGATWVSNKYPDRAPEGAFLARCFVGGDRTGGELAADDDGLVRMCREELGTIAGIEAAPVLTRTYRHTRAGPQYDVGHLDRVEEIESLACESPGLRLAGSAYHGVGIPDCVESGRAAARGVIEALERG